MLESRVSMFWPQCDMFNFKWPDGTRLISIPWFQAKLIDGFLLLIIIYESHFDLTCNTIIYIDICVKCHSPHLTTCNARSKDQKHFVKAIHGLLFCIPNLQPVQCGRCRQIQICLGINSLGHHVCCLVDLVLSSPWRRGKLWWITWLWQGSMAFQSYKIWFQSFNVYDVPKNYDIMAKCL